MTNINESIVSAGFGGQGIMVLGKVFANAGMITGLNVTYLPSYGVEVRGGTAHSMVHVSSAHIGSPVVEDPTAGIIMNDPSLNKFEGRLAKNALMIVNTSMVRHKPKRKDLDIVEAPLTDAALELGNVRVANIIAAGVYVARKKIFTKDVMIEVIHKMAGDKKQIIPINIKAIERGMEIGG